MNFKIQYAVFIVGAGLCAAAALVSSAAVKDIQDYKKEVRTSILTEKPPRNSEGSCVSPQERLSFYDCEGTGGEAACEEDVMPLDVRLLGTVLDRASAIAYIEDTARSRVRRLKIGDPIKDAWIVDIQPGRAVLARNGQKEILELAKTKEEAVKKISPTEAIVYKEGAIKEIIEDAKKTKTVKTALDYIDLTAKDFSGVKIQNVPKGGIIEAAGFRNGDIIKVVNDQRLTTPQRAMQVFQKLRNQGAVELSLERNKKPVNLKYKIR